jgi:hypothetical protein
MTLPVYITDHASPAVADACKELGIQRAYIPGHDWKETKWTGIDKLVWEGFRVAPPDFNGPICLDWEYHDGEGNPLMAGRELDLARLELKRARPLAKHCFYLHANDTGGPLSWSMLRAYARLQSDLRQWWAVCPALYQWTRTRAHCDMVDTQMGIARLCAKGTNIIPLASPRCFYETPANRRGSLDVDREHLQYLFTNYRDLDGFIIFDANSLGDYEGREQHTIDYCRMVREVAR